MTLVLFEFGLVWFGEMDLKMFIGIEKSPGVGGCVGVDDRNENRNDRAGAVKVNNEIQRTGEQIRSS